MKGFKIKKLFILTQVNGRINDNETVHLFSNKIGRIFGILGCHVPSNRLIEDLKDQGKEMT